MTLDVFFAAAALGGFAVIAVMLFREAWRSHQRYVRIRRKVDAQADREKKALDHAREVYGRLRPGLLRVADKQRACHLLGEAIRDRLRAVDPGGTLRHVVSVSWCPASQRFTVLVEERGSGKWQTTST